MLIDWFTVIAQIINFIILVVLLKIFLYGPVVRAIDRRKKESTEAFDEARKQQEQADEQKQQLQQEEKELQQEREDILGEARQQAEEKRKELEHQVRQEIDEKRRQWARSLEQQQDRFIQSLRTEMARQLSDTARKVLADLADVDLQQQVVSAFVSRLDSLDDDEKRQARQAAGDGQSLQVITAWDLDEQQQEKLRDQIPTRLEIDGGKLDFQTDPELICGIELRSGGRSIAWNVSQYLRELTERVEDQIEQYALSATSGEQQDSGDQQQADQEES